MNHNDRIIVHSDINHCFAQIEEMKQPFLRDVPMVVAGSSDDRHGIVVARNLKAKEFGIVTAEPVVKAKQKCRNLVIVSPNYEDYTYYSEKVKNIYRDYTDKVESFGIDEAWFDLTQSQKLFGNGLVLAKKIQKRVLDEVGLTVSMGISWNKIFAKLGSDMVKPSGFTHISKENYRELAWSLPVSDLLFVGSKTHQKLIEMGIHTIGDLALSSHEKIIKRFGKSGDAIWYFANGLDTSEVKDASFTPIAKSVGNSITTTRDIRNYEDARIVYRRLCESVASRLRDNNQVGSVVAISFRDIKLHTLTRQKTLKQPSDISDVFVEHAMHLLKSNYHFDIPLRSIGISVSKLEHKSANMTNPVQYNLFEDITLDIDRRIIDLTMDKIRDQYGFDSVKRCSVLLDEALTDINPKEKHTIFPPGNYKGK